MHHMWYVIISFIINVSVYMMGKRLAVTSVNFQKAQKHTSFVFQNWELIWAIAIMQEQAVPV